MATHPRKAWQLLRQSGPRWYFEVESRSGTGANLDHPLWRFPGVRFLVHMTALGDPLGIGTPEEFAAGLIENIETFRANYLSEQPAGTVFPGYGIRFPFIGGWYAWRDFDGLIPAMSNNKVDSLSPFINAFTYTPVSSQPPSNGFVTEVLEPPTAAVFEIGSGGVFGRPAGGLVGNLVRFLNGPLAGQARPVASWASNVVVVASSFSVPPEEEDECVFFTDPCPACYRFTQGRADLEAWSDAFFGELDATWPTGLERPEHLAATAENFAEPDTAWHPDTGSIRAYIADTGVASSQLTPDWTFAGWLNEFGKDLDGATITFPSTTNLGPRSPSAQDQRSLAFGAFMVGLAWSWQLSFVDRMKISWPTTRFLQYQLHSARRHSPLRNQPGEVFYHGDPWPPDVGHSYDEYNFILPYLFPAADLIPGVAGAAIEPVTFSVASGPFLTISDWGDPGRDTLSFALDTATSGLRGKLFTIDNWSSPDVTVSPSVSPPPVSGDVFDGLIANNLYNEWAASPPDHVGWAIWAAWQDFYGHTTGSIDERFAATCVSYVLDQAKRMCDSWTDRDVAPFVSRRSETHSEGRYPLTAAQMYPEPALICQPGIQTREDWTTMLSGMMLAGMPRIMVFETQEQDVDTLDAWLEIFQGVRGEFNRNRPNLEAIAHHRNRNWRSRRTWR